MGVGVVELRMHCKRENLEALAFGAQLVMFHAVQVTEPPLDDMFGGLSNEEGIVLFARRRDSMELHLAPLHCPPVSRVQGRHERRLLCFPCIWTPLGALPGSLHVPRHGAFGTRNPPESRCSSVRNAAHLTSNPDVHVTWCRKGHTPGCSVV